MLDTLWSKFILQLNKENPFFACLALFTVLVPDDKIEYGVTDTKELRINPDFLLSESEEKAFSYLLHQVLHLALQHNFRSGGRKLEYWNIAADIVVNEIIAIIASNRFMPSCLRNTQPKKSVGVMLMQRQVQAQQSRNLFPIKLTGTARILSQTAQTP